MELLKIGNSGRWRYSVAWKWRCVFIMYNSGETVAKEVEGRNIAACTSHSAASIS